jgi:hypothetical protein
MTEKDGTKVPEKPPEKPQPSDDKSKLADRLKRKIEVRKSIGRLKK